MFLQRREIITAFDPGRDILDDVAHDFVVGLVGERLEGLDHGEAGVNHRGQLAD